MKQRVAVGLSGGVDSSVAAALLIEQGYDVTGVYLTCWEGPGCRSEEDRQDALDIALQLNIPFEHLNFKNAYKEKVYEYMVREYEAGRTPNPDVICNREIKFGLFYEWALRQGFDYVATGHYAQINCSRQPNLDVLDLPAAAAGSRSVRQSWDCQLLRSNDEHKDQTYFLYQLRAEQLSHILFPIGHLTKDQVRDEAEKRELLTAKKPDSTGICFIGEVPISKFLEERIKPVPGEIMLSDSSISFDSAVLSAESASPNAAQKKLTASVGIHKGVWFYTIGQRISVTNAKNLKALGFDTTNLPHFYVVDKDIEKNILYVGLEEDTYKNSLEVHEPHWIDSEIARTFGSEVDNLTVRIRHTGELIPVKGITIMRTSHLTIKLSKPARGVASGQVAVFYDGEMCLGGGVIG